MSDEFDDNNAQLNSESEVPTPDTFRSSRWLLVGLGFIGLVLILALAWPVLSDQIATRRNSGEASIAELEQAAADDPENHALQYELAGAYYRAHRFEDAWDQFRAVEAYRVAADGRPDILEAEQAVQAEPKLKEPHFKLGTAWARAQLLVPAEIAYDQAIAIDSQYADAHTNLGVVYYQMGRLSDALSQYDAALAVSPDDADIHYNKGATLVQMALQASPIDESLMSQGVSEFQLALELDPNLPQAHFSLGVVYDKRGQKQEAISEFQLFLELDDGSDPTATAAAQDYLSQLSK
jgi:tetratricopeptide (TPR) repeat protein